MKTKTILIVLFILIPVFSFGQIRIVFRCDDYTFKDDSLQEKIIKIFEKNEIPYCFCVIPYDKNDHEINSISNETLIHWKRLKEKGLLDIGQHGYMHYNLNPNICKWNELEDLSYKQQIDKFSRGKKFIESHVGHITYFVPPRNVINEYTTSALKDCGFDILSANVSNYSTQGDDVAFYPCTTEDFKEFADFYYGKRYEKYHEGTIILLFHGYTFTEGRYSLQELDQLLSSIKENPNFKPCTLTELYKEGAPEYDRGLRGKYFPLYKMIYGDDLLFLNKPSKLEADFIYFVLFFILGLFLIIPVLMLKRRILNKCLYIVVMGLAVATILFTTSFGIYRVLAAIVLIASIIDILANIKTLKSFIRHILIYCRYLVYRYAITKQYQSFKVFKGKLQSASKHKDAFFGYYNVSPENDKGQVVYCVPSKDKEYVTLYCNDNGNEIVVGTTRAYNWQQGCMSQWGYKNTNLIYYNVYDSETDCYKAIVFDINSQKDIKKLSMPIYALSKQEDYYLSLNFDRLAIMRPDYGYFCRTNIELPDNEQDGIWKIDIVTGKTSLLITLQQLIDLKYVPSMEGAMHKVNHIDISPDGTRFMFLHRWVGPKGRYMRLITANAEGSDLYILNGDKMTSHSYWVDNSRIVSFCHTEKYNDAYVMFTDLSDSYELLTDILPIVDGHPSTTKDGILMITDQYPSLNRMSKLFLYNITSKELTTVGQFYQPLRYFGTNRIDLHPKWNMFGNKIYFESGHNGKRNLYVVDLSSDK